MFKEKSFSDSHLTKQAGRFDSALNSIRGAARRGLEDMRATRVDRRALLDQTKDSFSFTGTIMNSMKEHDIVGANTLGKLMQKARYKISDADTFLGSMAAGKDWKDASKGSMRQKLFTDTKDNYLREGDNYRKVKVPSISTPIKEVAHVAVPMLAMDSAFTAMDKYRKNKAEKEQQQAPQTMYNQYY